MLTQEQIDRIKSVVWDHPIGKGLGTRYTACSIASLNIALTGELTDYTPECMSLIIGEWVRTIQDAMPDYMRNSLEWRNALILAAGTGRKKELERLALIMDWLFGVVLPILQSQADAGGYGPAWQKMCEERTEAVAVARLAVEAAVRVALAVAAEAEAVEWTERSATETARIDFWQKINPPGLLARLVAL